jgi:catechol 1,2-dioxygenase
MLRATGRGSWRPGHVHTTVTSESHLPVTTHIFDAESEYLEEDAVFAVKASLLRTFVERARGREQWRPWQQIGRGTIER